MDVLSSEASCPLFDRMDLRLDLVKITDEPGNTKSSNVEIITLLRNFTDEKNLPPDVEEWSYEKIRDWVISEGWEVLSLPKNLGYLLPAMVRDGDCGRPFNEPPWLDKELFAKGQKFAMDNFFGLCFANLVSLCLIFTDVDGLKPMIISGQSSTPYHGFKRYLSTVHRVRTWYTQDPWNEASLARKNIRMVRKMHLAMRTRLCQSTWEEILSASKITAPWCSILKLVQEDARLSVSESVDISETLKQASFRPKGLNQADMSITQFAFMGLITSYPEAFGVHGSTTEDIEAFCHCWRVLGYLLGIEDEFNFCRGSLRDIRERSANLIEMVFKPKLRNVEPEWEHMTRCIVEGMKYYLLKSPTYVHVILFMSDLLHIPMPRLRASIGYILRLKHVVSTWIVRYVTKIPGVVPRLNKLINLSLDRAVQFSPEKHAALEARSAKTLLDNTGICLRDNLAFVSND